MAHNCAVLRIDPAATLALYQCRDPDALRFLQWVIDSVDQAQRESRARHESERARIERQTRG